MRTVTLRNIQIGSGIPKVIVPIVGETSGDIIAMGKKLAQMPADAVEWRADFFADIHDKQAVLDTLGELRRALGDIPLIFTCRTIAEGGSAYMDENEYAALNRAACGIADGIDIEVLSHGDVSLIRDIREAGCVVIGSHHITEGTPSRAEMADVLRRISDMGADIPKLAVNARCTGDTLKLMAATKDACGLGVGPVITMAIGQDGILSRVAGEIFGAAATFASVGRGSAAGQLSLEAMNELLKAVHSQI